MDGFQKEYPIQECNFQVPSSILEGYHGITTSPSLASNAVMAFQPTSLNTGWFKIPQKRGDQTLYKYIIHPLSHH